MMDDKWIKNKMNGDTVSKKQSKKGWKKKIVRKWKGLSWRWSEACGV